MTSETVDRVDELHSPGGVDLHYRYVGTAAGRDFVVNIQFGSSRGLSDERLRPEELDFMIAKVLGLILQRLAENPNSALH